MKIPWTLPGLNLHQKWSKPINKFWKIIIKKIRLEYFHKYYKCLINVITTAGEHMKRKFNDFFLRRLNNTPKLILIRSILPPVKVPAGSKLSPSNVTHRVRTLGLKVTLKQ